MFIPGLTFLMLYPGFTVLMIQGFLLTVLRSAALYSPDGYSGMCCFALSAPGD